MMPRLVTFDIDGTLLDAAGAGRRSLDRALEERFGHPELSRGVAFGGRMDPDIVAGILASLEAPAGDRDAILRRYVEILEQELQRQAACILPDVLPVLEVLAARKDVIPGLVTGNVREGARLKLGSVGLWERFDVGAFGEEAASRAELVALARRRAGELIRGPEEELQAFHVGDTTHDVHAALAGGAVPVAVATGVHSLETLEPSGPRHLLPSLAPAEQFLELVLA